MMGRGKIEIKKIENSNSRQVTFSKRRSGLLKKAYELGVLCDAQVAVIIFSNNGKLFEFSSCNMQQILSRYNKCLEPSKSPKVEDKPEEPKQEDILRKEIMKLEMKLSQLLGKNLTGLGMKELTEIEQKLNEGLLSVKERKERILVEQLELSRIQEQRALEEIQTLRMQIDELQPLQPPTDSSVPVRVDCYPANSKGVSTKGYPNRELEYEVDHDDTNLSLGFSPLAYGKERKPAEAAESNVTVAQKRKRSFRC